MSLNRPEPPSMGPVASLLAMDRTTLTAAVKPLLKIKSDPKDRRSRILILTDKGRNLLARALPVWQSTHEDIEKNAPGIDWNDFRKNLLAVS